MIDELIIVFVLGIATGVIISCFFRIKHVSTLYTNERSSYTSKRPNLDSTYKSTLKPPRK